MENSNYLLSAILIMAIVNFSTRVLPFIFFRSSTPPASIVFLERYFPPIIMTILVFYFLKDINFGDSPYGLYELSAVTLTVILHLVFKNYLFSIFGATLFYMSLVQGWFGA